MSGVPPSISIDSNAVRYCANIANVNLSAARASSDIAQNFVALHQACEASVTYTAFGSSFIPNLLPALAARQVVAENARTGTLSVGATANLAFDTYTKICRYAYKLPATPYSDTNLAAIIARQVNSLGQGMLPATAAIDAAVGIYLTWDCGRIPPFRPKEVEEFVDEPIKIEQDNRLWETGLIAISLSALYQGAKYIGKRAGSAAIGGPAGILAGIALTVADLWSLMNDE